MRSWTALVVGVMAVLVAVVAAVATLFVADDDWSGHRGAMMSTGGGGSAGHAMAGMPVATEYDYLAEMIAHHEEAVAAAGELQRSERPEIRAFGASIVTSQTTQIDQMEDWLVEWYPNRSGRADYRPMMRDLGDLSGDDLDRAFLEDMIGHHMAAVMMSQQLLARGVADHAGVEEVARTIRDDQHVEIFQMQDWLSEWFGHTASMHSWSGSRASRSGE